MPASPAFAGGVQYAAAGMSNTEGKAQEKAPAIRLAVIRLSPLAAGFCRTATEQLSLIKAREPASLFAKIPQRERFPRNGDYAYHLSTVPEVWLPAHSGLS